jgi:hypothetical protein
MDLEWLERAELEYEDDLNYSSQGLNEYQKSEEQVMELFEAIHDYLHESNERFFMKDITIEQVAGWLYSKSYLEQAKKTEEGSKLY